LNPAVLNAGRKLREQSGKPPKTAVLVRKSVHLRSAGALHKSAEVEKCGLHGLENLFVAAAASLNAFYVSVDL
jgi:hypothetical protein